MKILHLDTNHPILIAQLNNLGFTNDEDYTSSKARSGSKMYYKMYLGMDLPSYLKGKDLSAEQTTAVIEAEDDVVSEK